MKLVGFFAPTTNQKQISNELQPPYRNYVLENDRIFDFGYKNSRIIIEGPLGTLKKIKDDRSLSLGLWGWDYES